MALCACLAMVAMASPGWAATKPKQQVRKKFRDKIHVVQRKPVLQKKRFELSPSFGTTFNDPLYRSFKLGVAGRYHINERLFVGGLFDWYDFGGTLGGPTDVRARVISQTNSAPDTPVPIWAGGLEVGFVPIFGKFSLFNRKLGFYDVGVSAGGMYVSSRSLRLPAATQGPGATLSIFNHIFLSEWFSLNFEVRETLYFATIRGADSPQMSHAVTASGGIGLYFPRRFEYTAPEGSELVDE